MWILSQRARVEVDRLLVLMPPLVSEALFEETLRTCWRTICCGRRVGFPVGHYLIERAEELYRQLHREHAKVVRISADTVGLDDLSRFYLDHASRQGRLTTDDRVRTKDEIFGAND